MSHAAPNAKSRPVAVVTGGTRGIGLGIVHDLAPTHHVVVGGRTAESVDRAARDLPSAEGFVADLADCAPGGSLETALAALVPRLERVDVLVHSAGVGGFGRVEALDARAWHHVLDVNVVAVGLVTRALLPSLRAARGLVVAVNSGSGFRSNPGGGAYAASKFALRALTDALREEERASGVRVTSVHPGRVDTDMQHELVDFEGSEYDEQAYLDVESVVDAVRFAVQARPRASVDSVLVRPRGFRE
jgi:NAD(P)-dependent dehydrogenase (short-subunit alcohol dehydrogenase family)